MSELNRRRFIKLIGQGTAALGIGIGISRGVSAKTGGAGTDAAPMSGTKATNGKYQIFQPGEYLDWEKKTIEEKIAQARGEEVKVDGGPPGGGIPTDLADNPMMAGGAAGGGNNAVDEADLLKYNGTWDPYNPLFNNKDYALKAGYPNVSAWPCYKSPRAGKALILSQDIADMFYFANDGSDMEFYTPIYPGDTFTSELEKMTFDDITVPGSDLRAFITTNCAKMYNQRGELAVRCTRTLRNSYRKIVDGSRKPTYSENMSEWCAYFPPAHYTTDEEWEYIKELWKNEKIRGSEKLYWEDVAVGDEPTPVCSGPVSYMDMMAWHGGARGSMMRNNREGTSTVFRDQYGNYLIDTAMHYGNRNIPGARMVFYNNTAANHITRMVTNYIGDAGFVTRICWKFKQLFKEMLIDRPGGEFLDLVPYMKGKACNRHGSEGDTVIGKGYVTKKYINEKKEHIIDLTCWGETLDGDIVQVVAASAKLPSKKG